MFLKWFFINMFDWNNEKVGKIKYFFLFFYHVFSSKDENMK